MTHHRMSRLRSSLAAVAILAATGSPAAAQEPPSYVVLASTAPAFVVGALVHEDATLEVPQGATLTLIDAVGKIKIIEGPFLGRLRSDVEEDPEGSSFLSDLADIIAEAETVDVALGLGRSTLAPETSPWLVAFDEALGPDLCVSPAGQLAFYRTETAYPGLQSVRFGSADGPEEAIVTWSIDEQVLRWPEALPPEDGGSYVIDPGAAPAPAEVRMHLAPADLASDAHLAVWMAQNGCTTQAEAMVRRMALGG